MNITGQLTDDTILRELGGRLARARLDRNLTQADLAGEAGVSKRTVERLESGTAATQLSSLLRVCRILDLVEQIDSFIPEPVPSPIERLKRKGRQRQRQRASGGKATLRKPGKWTWGDEP